jgi:hypothetical protein
MSPRRARSSPSTRTSEATPFTLLPVIIVALSIACTHAARYVLLGQLDIPLSKI